MTVFVTGAAGFLGYHLSLALLSRGARVIGVDNFQTGSRRNIADLEKASEHFHFVEGDVLDASVFEELRSKWASGGDSPRVYHLACPASPPLYQKDELNTLEICYRGSMNVLEFAKSIHARVLLASTSEIYGDPEVHPQPESYRGNVNTMGPRSCYDEGKRVMETLGFIYRSRGLDVRTARIFNTYGPRMSPNDGRVMTNFIKQALSGEPLTIYGDGTQTRSLCFCDDLIDGFLRLMDSDLTEPINLGSQEEFSVRDLAEVVKDLVRPDAKIVHLALPTDDPKCRRPDTRLAKELLGWQAKVSLKDGVRVMVEDLKAQLGLSENPNGASQQGPTGP